MARKTRRANYRCGAGWKVGNTLDRRSTIGLGCLNVNGWSDIAKDDVEKAMETLNLDVFSLVEANSKKKARREEKDDRMEWGIACAAKKSTGVNCS